MRRKVELIQKVLNQHFPNPPIPLDHKDPYTFLIAVLLSAQSTDKKVNEITPALFTLADNPFDMSLQDPDKVQEIIRPIGLFKTKAKAIVALSKILVENYNGRVPNTFKELEALPGVGHKTASVVMSQVYKIPAFPIDTHIHRCAKRWGLSSGKSVIQTERDLKKHFPKEAWNKLHLQIIFFARAYCPAKKHTPSTCPICKELSA